LVVLGDKAFTDQDTLIDKRFLFIHSHLSEGHVEFVELPPEVFKISGLQIQLNLTPLELWISSKIWIGHLGDNIEYHIGVIDALIIHKVHRFWLGVLRWLSRDLFKIAT
jgi:hypothetical protein